MNVNIFCFSCKWTISSVDFPRGWSSPATKVLHFQVYSHQAQQSADSTVDVYVSAQSQKNSYLCFDAVHYRIRISLNEPLNYNHRASLPYWLYWNPRSRPPTSKGSNIFRLEALPQVVAVVKENKYLLKSILLLSIQNHNERFNI